MKWFMWAALGIGAYVVFARKKTDKLVIVQSNDGIGPQIPKQTTSYTANFQG